MGKEVGIAIPPIDQGGFSVLADDEVLREGHPILGSFLGVWFFRDGRKCLLVGKVIDFEVVNDLSEYLALVKNIRSVITNEQVQRVLDRKSGLVLRCQVVSSFDLEKRIRVPYDIPIRPFSKCVIVGDEMINKLIKHPERGDGDRFFYAGRFYGTSLKQPLYLEDFSKLDEAYHFAVVGLSGSGKSTLAKIILLGYARNRDMNFFVLDTVGEFSRGFQDQNVGHFSLSMASLWSKMGRGRPVVFGLDDLSLASWDLFEALLVKMEIFKELQVKSPENQKRAAHELRVQLKDKKKLKLGKLEQYEEVIREVLSQGDFLEATYSDSSRREAVKRFVGDDDRWKVFWKRFKDVAGYFQKGKPTPEGLVRRLKDERGVTIVLDFSSLGWEDPFKYLLISEVVRRLYRVGMDDYRERGKASFNTLVVVEEAHRLVPPSSWVKQEGEEMEKARATLLRALTETRKAGLGWMFISTRIGNLDRAVFEEARVRIVGWGLGTGDDADRLREVFGREVLAYYAGLPDPSDPLMEKRKHVFLVSGPICVLSRRYPEFVEVFSDPQELLRVNGFVQ